jgi:polar amino acid transport system substrate-binding protein
MFFYKFLLGACLVVSVTLAETIDDFQFITEHSPSSNMIMDNQLTGYAVDILEKMLELSHSKKTKKDFKVFPWARGYSMVQKKPNTVLFAMLRTKQRENLFKWVGPIKSSKVSLIGKKSRNIKINSLDDILKYSIGTIKDDVAELELKELGIKSFDSISGTKSIETSIKKLQRDRIDLFAYSYVIDTWKIKGFDPKDYESVYTLKENSLYYAFHKDTDQKIIDQLQTTLDQLKEQGIVKKIISKYK